MKQKLFIFLTFTFLLLVLVGLNAVSYVQKEKIPDLEEYPNRSTYNPGATGTRAFYDLLAETGKKVRRWQEPFPVSGAFEPDKFSTFVIIGRTRRSFEAGELKQIGRWVSEGGTLVVIDRDPPDELLSTTGNWSVSNGLSKESPFRIDPSNQTQMVADTPAVKPVQPTVYTAGVNAVQPSRFASSIGIKRLYDEEEFADENFETDEEEIIEEPAAGSDAELGTGNKQVDELFQTPETPPPPPTAAPPPEPGDGEKYLAPVIHLADKEKGLLADFPYGRGRVIFLSDPYIVSNAGIKLVDNAQIGVNIVSARSGMIAFDEYHQGYGRNDNLLIQYFTGTPVIPIFLQIILLAAIVFYSQSRRFARALPAPEKSRLSKLEYVSAMAELQGRTRAFDLAVENIYREFRRRVSRLVGIDNHTATREDIAEKIAERTDYESKEVAGLMFECEDIMHGEPTDRKKTVELIGRLREIEEALGLRRGKKG